MRATAAGPRGGDEDGYSVSRMITWTFVAVGSLRRSRRAARDALSITPMLAAPSHREGFAVALVG